MKYIVANWKSNKLLSEALEWVEEVGSGLQKSDEVVAIVCPAMSSLSEVSKNALITGGVLKVGAQNASPYSFGSYTGEDSAEMIKQFGEYAIIGHSERRKYFSETDEMVAEKVGRVKEVGLEAIFCVQDADTPIPDGVTIVAYEPIFAIGTGVADTPENAQQVAAKIIEQHPDVTVLYGGSVTSENAGSFLGQELISGLLIGKASLDAKEFIEIVEIAHRG